MQGNERTVEGCSAVVAKVGRGVGWWVAAAQGAVGWEAVGWGATLAPAAGAQGALGWEAVGCNVQRQATCACVRPGNRPALPLALATQSPPPCPKQRRT